MVITLKYLLRAVISSLFLSTLTVTMLTQFLHGQEKLVAPGNVMSPLAVPHVPFGSTVASEHQAMMLRRLWGIEDVHIRSVASGSLIRFSYRIVDAEKAKVLNDKRNTPYLVDEKHGLALQIPSVDQVGQLRQVSIPQSGREYWMAFSNKGKSVIPGDRVTVVIGTFRAPDLVVEASYPRQNAR